MVLPVPGGAESTAVPPPVERGEQLGQGVTDREPVECVGSDHAFSLVRPAGACAALSTVTV
ncbi:hypothetical protein SSCG_04026 [Streptomyces clavuligerus]|nr:hypothetical protein SSCG_04026 [Streptomyces clavuligerus]